MPSFEGSYIAAFAAGVGSGSSFSTRGSGVVAAGSHTLQRGVDQQIDFSHYAGSSNQAGLNFREEFKVQSLFKWVLFTMIFNTLPAAFGFVDNAFRFVDGWRNEVPGEPWSADYNCIDPNNGLGSQALFLFCSLLVCVFGLTPFPATMFRVACKFLVESRRNALLFTGAFLVTMPSAFLMPLFYVNGMFSLLQMFSISFSKVPKLLYLMPLIITGFSNTLAFMDSLRKFAVMCSLLPSHDQAKALTFKSTSDVAGMIKYLRPRFERGLFLMRPDEITAELKRAGMLDAGKIIDGAQYKQVLFFVSNVVSRYSRRNFLGYFYLNRDDHACRAAAVAILKTLAAIMLVGCAFIGSIGGLLLAPQVAEQAVDGKFYAASPFVTRNATLAHDPACALPISNQAIDLSSFVGGHNLGWKSMLSWMFFLPTMLILSMSMILNVAKSNFAMCCLRNKNSRAAVVEFDGGEDRFLSQQTMQALKVGGMLVMAFLINCILGLVNALPVRNSALALGVMLASNIGFLPFSFMGAVPIICVLMWCFNCCRSRAATTINQEVSDQSTTSADVIMREVGSMFHSLEKSSTVNPLNATAETGALALNSQATKTLFFGDKTAVNKCVLDPVFDSHAGAGSLVLTTVRTG